MQRPEYFVLRVYRRAPDDPERIEGVVEAVASGTERPFASAQELWAILRQAAMTIGRTQSD
jgi:hypothetical protein